MAKSIRSKHRRRMRSVKREKFAKKDLVKLKEAVLKDAVNAEDKEMAEIVTVKTAAELKLQPSANSEDIMEIDGGAKKAFDKKTKKDEHGQYPSWMNQRAIRKQQVKNKKAKRNKGKKGSAW